MNIVTPWIHQLKGPSDPSPTDMFSPALRLLLIIVAAVASGLPVQSNAAPAPWEKGSYAYYADNTPIAKVLADFCANFAIKLDLADNATGKINGRVSATAASEFLNRVTATNGLTWYYYSGVLHVTPVSDWQTRSFAVSRDTLAGLKTALMDLGILDARFGWAVIAEQGLVAVSGPRGYLDLVATTLQSMQLASSGQKIAMFRLRHASAEDRTITTRDDKTVIPGVATILRALVAGKRADQTPKLRARGNPPSSTPSEEAAEQRTSPFLVPGGEEAKSRLASLHSSAEFGNGVTIESDARLNAVLIKDTPEAIPTYQRLIEALDVPTGLVEIEAMTIDINKTRMDELGIDWSATSRNVEVGLGDASRPAAGGEIALAYQPNAVAIVGQQAASLIAKIRALETKGEARVVGKPSIITTDNLIAIIDLSQTYYVALTGERVANLSPVTTGVMLKVTPHIIEHPQGHSDIKLAIDIEDGTLVNRAGITLPVVQRSVISTQATISENQSLLIGGYDTVSDSSSTAAVPLLSRLPGIGALFRNSQTDREDRKRLFLITPRIINAPLNKPPLTEN